MTGFHGIDIDPPVQRNEYRTAEYETKLFRACQRSSDGFPAPQETHHDGEKNTGPDDPVNQHLVRGHTLEKREVNGETAPQGIGGQAETHAFCCIRRSMFHRQQALYFLPLPQGQDSFRPGLRVPSRVSPDT